MMVYRPRYLDEKRNRRTEKTIRILNGELSIEFPDNSNLVFTKEGIMRRNPKGIATHFYGPNGSWFSADEIESGVIHE